MLDRDGILAALKFVIWHSVVLSVMRTQFARSCVPNDQAASNVQCPVSSVQSIDRILKVQSREIILPSLRTMC
jgi:hypothetical protein